LTDKETRQNRSLHKKRKKRKTNCSAVFKQRNRNRRNM